MARITRRRFIGCVGAVVGAAVLAPLPQSRADVSRAELERIIAKLMRLNAENLALVEAYIDLLLEAEQAGNPERVAKVRRFIVATADCTAKVAHHMLETWRERDAEQS